MQENDAVSYTKSDYWTKICRNFTTAKAYSRYAVYLFFILLDFRLASHRIIKSRTRYACNIVTNRTVQFLLFCKKYDVTAIVVFTSPYTYTYTHTHTQRTFFRDYPGQPVPER